MTKLDIAKKEGREMLSKFKCIQDECDGQGNIPRQGDDGEWEAYQCEFHAKYLFPLEILFASHERAIEIALLEDLVEEAEELFKSDSFCAKVIRQDHVVEYCEQLSDEDIHFNDALTTLITKYQDRIKKLKS